MADLHPLAKQIHQASPAPLRLELSDGTSGVFRMGHTEWFQTEFQVGCQAPTVSIQHRRTQPRVIDTTSVDEDRHV